MSGKSSRQDHLGRPNSPDSSGLSSSTERVQPEGAGSGGEDHGEEGGYEDEEEEEEEKFDIDE